MTEKKWYRKKAILVPVLILAMLVGIALGGRYGWKLGGFSACQSAGIEAVEVTDAQVRIVGYDPGLSPKGFLGYYARQEGQTLYVGFRFSGLFGIFETGDFDITVPTRGQVTTVIMKTQNGESVIWPQTDQ